MYRDLAARNVLVGDGKICKVYTVTNYFEAIISCGMICLSMVLWSCRLLTLECQLNCKMRTTSHGSMIPLKWTAPEVSPL